MTHILTLLLFFQWSIQDEAAKSNLEKHAKHTEIRQALHEKLLKTIVVTDPGAALWRDGEKKMVLSELIVFRKETVFKQQGTVDLDSDVSSVSRLFDHIVFRGDNLDNLTGVVFKFGNKSIRYKRFAKTDDGFVFGMIPIPLIKEKKTKFGSRNLHGSVARHANRNDQGISFSISCTEELTLKEIAFHSARGIHRDFQTMLDSWTTFSRGELDLNRAFYLETLKYKNIDDLVVSLNENSEILGRIVIPSRMSASENINLWGVLSDRRVAKLYELLSELDTDIAAEISQRNFVLELERYIESYATTDIGPLSARHAIEGQLFLCSEFCDQKQVLENIDRWKNWHAKHFAERSFQFKAGAGPDFLFVANTYANLIAKNRGFALDETNAWLEEIFSDVIPGNEPPPSLSENWLFTSDWTPTRKDALQLVPVFESSNPFYGKKRQDLALSILREQVEILEE